MLLTDGDISFAIFLYENFEQIIASFANDEVWESGFDAGIGRSGTRILGSGSTSELYFRIDGKLVSLMLFHLVSLLTQ